MGAMAKKLILFSKPPVQFAYRVTVTAAQSTTPKFTFAAGAPVARVDWGDSSTYETVTSGVELTHTYTNAGVYTVQLLMDNQAKWLIQIDINTDKVSWVFSQIGEFKKLTLFYARTNAAWSQNISGWVLPASLNYFSIYSTSVSGNISGWVLPPPLVTFYIYSTSLSGCPILSSMVSIQEILAQNCALPVATVDLYLSRCVVREAQTTYATPALNLSGTDAAPSDPAGLADKATLVGLNWVVTTN